MNPTDISHQIQAWLDEVKIFRDNGQYDEALARLEVILSNCRKDGLKQLEAKTLGNIGLVYKNLGWFEKSIQTFQRASEIQRNLSLWADLAVSLKNLGSALCDLGQVEEGLKFYRNASEICAEQKDLKGIATCEIFIGNALLRLEDFDQAKTHYLAATRIYQQLNDPINQGHLNSNLGALAFKQGNLSEALTFSKNALENYQRKQYLRGTMTALGNIGAIQMEMGLFDDAQVNLQNSLQMALSSGLLDFAWRITGNIAELHKHKGDISGAMETYISSLNTLDDLRSRLLFGYNRLDFLGQRLKRYADFIVFAIEHADNKILALEYVEKTRSRMLIEGLAFSSLKQPPRMSKEWIDLEKNILTELKSALAAEQSMEQLKFIEEITTQLEQHWSTTKDQFQEYIGLRRGEPITFKDLQKTLLDVSSVEISP